MNFTFADRLRYRFDNIMSRGPIALIGWLFVLSAVMILLVSLVVFSSGIGPTGEDGSRLSFFEVAWMSLMRTLDAGTMGGDSGSWSFLLAMFVITMGGIFVVSILIGILTSGIESRLDELRKGRSLVVETGHTVILGWSPQVFTIVSELVIANQNQPNPCIVILADRDKVEMEDEIRSQVGSTGRTRIVCRTGNPLDLSDLEIANPGGSRSIILLSPEGQDGDMQTVKTILALTNHLERDAEPYHIVTEVHEARNLGVAEMVGGQQANLLCTADLISQITAQTCRQSGLSVVYTDLLNFAGDEIYFAAEPRLVGKTFGEALLAYEDSTVIGLCLADGQVRLKPPLDTRIASGDQIIAISRDDDTIRLPEQPVAQPDAAAIREPQPQAPAPERTLILGWNERAPVVVRELDSYVAPGSEVVVMACAPEPEETLQELRSALRSQRLEFSVGDTIDQQTLERLDVPSFQHVIVLSDAQCANPQSADARTLVTLLHLRSIAERSEFSFSIVSEMQDVRNRNLAEVTRADDFIVSDQLISLLLAQISENKHLGAVFADLFDPDGAELYLKPAGDYVHLGRPVNFYTVVEAARCRDEVAVGYRLQADAGQSDKDYGVHINPLKSEAVTFGEHDRIIVLSEN